MGRRVKFSQSLIGFYIQHEKDSVPARIEGYLYSMWLSIYVEAAMSEDKEQERIWKDPFFSVSEKSKLITEATEYFFITFLLSHFKNGKSEKGWEKNLTRDDISEILPTNRFLNLFSRPRHQRSMFDHVEIVENMDVQYSSHEPNESFAFFEAFSYSLPSKSRFFRKNKWLILDTPFFRLQFQVSSDGYAMGLPIDFARYYLGFKKNTACRVNAVYKIRLKPWALLDFRSWRYLSKLFDSIELTEASFSESNFFKKISWDQVYTQSRVIEKLLQKNNDVVFG